MAWLYIMFFVTFVVFVLWVISVYKLWTESEEECDDKEC